MNNNDPQDARARGQAMRAARLGRVRMIRRRIIGGAVALFVAAWLLITIVLVSGHDPALAAKASSATTVASTPATTSTSSGSDSGTSSSTSSQTTGSSSNSSSSNNSSSGTVSSVTTSQS